MYIQNEELELVNSIYFQQPYGKSWVSFFNRETKEIQIFDPINLHIVQYIKIGQNIRGYQFSYDNSFLIIILNENYIMIQDLINDVKSYYNNVEAWKTFNNEVWIESKNELLIIKDNAIVSSTNDKIINYRFGLRFLVQSQKHCHKFISIGKTRMRYILSENNVTMKNFSSNINFWGVYNFDEYGKIFRFLNKLYRQMKLIRKIPDEQSIDNRCLKIVKIDVISLTFEIEDGVVYFKFIYASTAKIKRSWCGFDFIKFVMTNDLKKLIYQEEKKFKICSYKL